MVNSNTYCKVVMKFGISDQSWENVKKYFIYISNLIFYTECPITLLLETIYFAYFNIWLLINW